MGEDERVLSAADTALPRQRERSARTADTRRTIRHLLPAVPRPQPSMYGNLLVLVLHSSDNKPECIDVCLRVTKC